MYSKHNTVYICFMAYIQVFNFFFSQSKQAIFSSFFNPHHSVSGATGMKKRRSLGVLTPYICYSSHQARFLSGGKFLVFVATNHMYEQLHLDVSLCYSTQ